MLIQFLSDVHLEQGAVPFSDVVTPAADLLIVAGDVAPARHFSLPYFVRHCSEAFEKVLWVYGNHEWYSQCESMDEIESHMADLISEYSNVSIMNRDVIEWRGVNFVGCTMWSHVPASAREEAALCVNDYRFVRKEHGPVSPADTDAFHQRDSAFLSSNSTADSVVITHHAPRTRTTSHPRYAGCSNNCCFATDMNLPAMPKLWIAGHTHFNFDFVDGDTRFVSNMFRNENYRVPFSRCKTIEI
ncbi:Metallo-dependent phosphatase-like protein [Tribonema minus]|uniref:Metallo-dependent phosphatase-like protein n=1 Tax=Tribonema minus TaxID=303371 RepID=A0A835Z038_9STRA|nr:Metallo-dependent phosphatase-like protein [Tribonema minus]